MGCEIMSKSSELDRKVKLYILGNIDADYVECDDTDISAIKCLKDTFYAEYGWNVDQQGEQKALAEWLQGLPSAINIDFYNHEILKLAVLGGSIPENATEKQEDKIIDNWFNFIANKTCQLFRGYRIPKGA